MKPARLLLLAALLPGLTYAAGVLRLSAIPDEGPNEQQRRYASLVRYLSATLKQKVQFVPMADYTSVAEALGRRGIAFLCLREYEGPDSLAPMMREKFPGSFIANEAFDKDKASSWLAQGRADAVAFGKLFIANPDLPARFALDAPLNALRPELFYAAGAEGYTDYPALERCGADA